MFTKSCPQYGNPLKPPARGWHCLSGEKYTKAIKGSFFHMFTQIMLLLCTCDVSFFFCRRFLGLFAPRRVRNFLMYYARSTLPCGHAMLPTHPRKLSCEWPYGWVPPESEFLSMAKEERAKQKNGKQPRFGWWAMVSGWFDWLAPKHVWCFLPLCTNCWCFTMWPS